MTVDAYIAAKEVERIYMDTIYPLTLTEALKRASRQFSKEVNKKDGTIKGIIRGNVCKSES